MNILIVDDNEMNQRLLAAVLEGESHHVAQAKDGLEALEILARGSIDAIVSDILMPRMDGFQLCHEVRKSDWHKHIPFLLYTSTYLSSKDEKFGLSLGADAYLKKPLDAQQLLATLRQALAAPRRQDPSPGSTVEELKTLREYSECLIAKLEKRNEDLERAQRALGTLHTELNLRLEKLVDNEAHLRAIVEASPDCVKVLSVDGTLKSINPAGTRMLEADSPEQLVGKPMLGFVAKKHRLAVRAMHEKVLAGEQARLEFEMQSLKGSHRWVETHAVPLYDGSNRLKGALYIIRDFSEQKEAETACLMAEAKYRSIFENATEGIFQTTPEGKVLSVNPALARMFGHASPAKLIQECTDVARQVYVDPKDREEFKRLLAESDTVRNFESEQFRKDGSRIWTSVNARAVRDDLGRIQYFEGTTVDITERKATAAALAEETVRWRTLMQMSSDSIHLLDLEGNLLEANEAFYRGLGYASEERKGLNVADWDAQWTGEQLRERLLALVDTSTVFETQHRRKDGTVAAVEASVTGIRIGGKPLFFCITRDVTERKRVEARLQESEERYRKLAELSPDAIFIHCQGKIVWANQVALALFGAADSSQLASRNLFDLVHAESRVLVEERIRCRRKTQCISPAVEEKLLRLDGTPFVAEVAAASFVFDGQPADLIIARDITEKKALEEKMLRSQRLESIGTLAGGIAHDLNNVLAPILMSLELLQLNLKDEKGRKILTTIATSAQRGADLVKQVLAFSRGIQGQRMNVQMRHIIREIQGVIRQTFSKSITLQLELAVDLWTVPGHATQLHQVLMNLCVNARDAMPDGGTLKIRAANLVLDQEYTAMNPEAKPGPYVVLSVADTGTGMPPAVRRRMFEPFFTTKDQGKGTGLGLSTVLSIVKNHGGFLSVESEVGRGAKFEVYLPAERAATIQPAAATQMNLPTGQGELILVADDELAIQRITQETLRMCGYRVLTASDGAEAVALAAQHAQELRLLITDMMMPVMDGRSTAQVARRLVPNIRIIAASGLDSETSDTDPKKLGVDAFLRKPFTAETLVRTVGEMLSSK